MNAYVNLRIVTSSEDAVFDTEKKTSGNPLLVTFSASNTTIYNNSELFYNFNVPSTFLSKGYIDVEIEVPILNGNINFTGSALNRFFFFLYILYIRYEI